MPEIVFLSVGLSLTLCWLYLGVRMVRSLTTFFSFDPNRLQANNKTRHWLASTAFHLLSFLQIIHLAYRSHTVNNIDAVGSRRLSFAFQTIAEYQALSKRSHSTLFPLLVLIFVCSGANLVIHLFTSLISCVLMDKV